MKNKLWRFGDSWSTTKDDEFRDIELNHSQYIADYFDLDYKNLGAGGFSNLEIFSKLLENNDNYKKNDIILINFASVFRIAVVENGKISCTSNGDFNNEQPKLMQDIILNDMGKPISDILFFLIAKYLKTLEERQIRIYYFFLDGHGKLDLKNQLEFRGSQGNGFIFWCKDNGYEDLSPNGNVHYTVGSQKSIANKIIELIEQYDNQEK